MRPRRVQAQQRGRPGVRAPARSRGCAARWSCRRRWGRAGPRCPRRSTGRRRRRPRADRSAWSVRGQRAACRWRYRRSRGWGWWSQDPPEGDDVASGDGEGRSRQGDGEGSELDGWRGHQRPHHVGGHASYGRGRQDDHGPEGSERRCGRRPGRRGWCRPGPRARRAPHRAAASPGPRRRAGRRGGRRRVPRGAALTATRTARVATSRSPAVGAARASSPAGSDERR